MWVRDVQWERGGRGSFYAHQSEAVICIQHSAASPNAIKGLYALRGVGAFAGIRFAHTSSSRAEGFEPHRYYLVLLIFLPGQKVETRLIFLRLATWMFTFTKFEKSKREDAGHGTRIQFSGQDPWIKNPLPVALLDSVVNSQKERYHSPELWCANLHLTDLHCYEVWKLQPENYSETFIFLIVVSAQVKNCEHDVMSNTHYR